MNCVKEALKEDIGKKDITTEIFIPKNKTAEAVLLAKEDAVVCGLGFAGKVFKAVDRKIKFRPCARDGDLIKKGKILARVSGKARGILTAERVALNFLGLLSGIATRTRKYVNAVKPYKTKILDTRKTIPGLRELQKYAVRTGGGYNHRLRLDEMVLVKDNHFKIISGYKRLPKLPKVSKSYQIELEAKDLKEFKAALRLNPDIIMLDNMSIEDIKKAVQIRNRLMPHNQRLSPKLEASGGITLKNVRKIASCGVEMVSVGALTHSLNSIDISLEIL